MKALGYPGLALFLAGFAAGCGAAAPAPSRTMPEDADARDRFVDTLGQAAWDALTSGDPTGLLADASTLAVLLTPAASARLTARRPGARARLGEVVHQIPEQLAHASYLGVCAEDAREQPPGGALGLRAPTWIIGRILVAGRLGGSSRRIALWLDGPFAFDGVRFVALELESVEAPRWEHSDLELARCDVSEGL